MPMSEFITSFGVALILCVLITGTQGSNIETCPLGWFAYQKEIPNKCLYLSSGTMNTLAKAHEECVQKNASLIVIQSEEKMKFFKEIVKKYLDSSTKIWIGQQKLSNYNVVWLTKDGTIPADDLPYGMRYSNWRYEDWSYGLIFKSNRLYEYRDMRYESKNARFICEKRAECSSGWYGLACDKQCHCHGQECDTHAIEMTCKYGCQVGWTGIGCSQVKEDAEVRYFCVNSKDQGKFVDIRIDTKGINYENIHSVDNDGNILPWCNSTIIQTDARLNLVSMQIFTTNLTDAAGEAGNCSGKINEKGDYEWQIKIQEKAGIVSRNDQEVHLECDFSKGDTLQLSRSIDIKHERWFKRANIKKPVQYLNEKKEKVSIDIADPATGKRVSEAQIGSPVVLRITYGLVEDNKATGIRPYNCDAVSKDGKQRARFLDDRSCPLEGFPISSFSRNGTTKSIVTKPFPLFGFDGNTEVHFHCSYTLCFVDAPCSPDCLDTTESPGQNATIIRHRRSARRAAGTVNVIFN